MSNQKCPSCKNDVPELVSLDEATRGELSEFLGGEAPLALCQNCYSTYSKKLKSQVDKEARRAAKEANRLSLWRRRVDIIRDARDRFADRDFGAAVVSYEKYLRIIEMIYDVKPNHLKVDFFNNPARAKEMVLLASTYWDLVRIYDQSDRFSKRFQECADKLIEFLPLTPLYSEIVRRLAEYRKTAKHKDTFNKIYNKVQKKKKRCFIATAAFEYESTPTVEALCKFRDEILIRNSAGRAFTSAYYFFSPAVAEVLDRSPRLRKMTRVALTTITKKIDKKYNLKCPPY
jgi:hypothetical protein